MLRFSEMPSSPINFHFLEQIASLKERRRLKRFLLRMLSSAGKKVKRLDYIFCNDDYLLKINKQYLNHDYYTDIITFDLSKRGYPIEAEIYISIPRIKENAAKFETLLKVELHRVIFHGALHLIGQTDKSVKQKKLMREKEDKCLALYFQ